MKALKILLKDYENVKYLNDNDIQSEFGYDKKSELDEAITELEALIQQTDQLQQLTCDGCINFNGSVCTDLDWCKRDNRLQDNFKQKDTK